MSMSPYKRRGSFIRNFWIYRRLVGAAIVLGLVLWFMISNNDAVKIIFPFGLGKLDSTTGVVILISAACGSIVTFLIMTILQAFKRYERNGTNRSEPEGRSYQMDDDRPPADYAAKATEGLKHGG